jgi:Fur family zinc uptake transcriptional regulator
MRTAQERAALRREAIADDKPLTRNERVVLTHLQKSRQPLKAYQLLENLREHGLRAPMTVYRALTALMRRGLVRKIASANAFIAASPDKVTAPGAYFICRSCGKTIEKPIELGEIQRLFPVSTVQIDQIFVEAHGECLDTRCVKAAP